MSLREMAYEVRKSLGCTLLEAERVVRHRVRDKKVFQARPAVLAERYPRTFSLYPVADYWYLDHTPVAQRASEFCDEPGHAPDCIRFVGDWLQGCSGTWKLKVPISVQGAMPGTEHELDYVRLESGLWKSPYCYGVYSERALRIYADGDKVFEALTKFINQPDGSFGESSFPDLARDITGYDTLQVELWAATRSYTGGLGAHFRKILFTVLYVPTTPPEPAVVRVCASDRKTGGAIKNAYVALMSGDTVVADGYTASNGWVTFENVPGGTKGISYTLLVLASGYHEYEESKDIVPGENLFRIKLAPIPVPPIPDWVWWALAGIGGIGAITIIPRVIPRKKEKPPIIVVR